MDEDDLELLKLDAKAAWRISADGRLTAAAAHPSGPWRESPGGGDAPPPRLYFAGCAFGNIAFAGEAVPTGLAERLLHMATREPPWFDADEPPAWLGSALGLLAEPSPPSLRGPEVVFRLPNGSPALFDLPIVSCETEGGRALIERLQREGPPGPLVEAGFVSLQDFWWPWCAALAGDEIAAMAFATRLSEASAEIGVYTFAPFRGRGFAAAVTAAWSQLRCLEGRALIYATRANNASSRRVTERLGLAAVGARLWID